MYFDGHGKPRLQIPAGQNLWRSAVDIRQASFRGSPNEPCPKKSKKIFRPRRNSSKKGLRKN